MHSILIPASGSATRMRGLPKFLLPSGNGILSLLENHIVNVANFADEILIGLNPMFLDIVQEANLELCGAHIIPMKTATMTETVLNLVNDSKADMFTILMPDTAFGSTDSYKFDLLNSDLNLKLWKIRNDQFGKLGQVLLGPTNEVLDLVDKDFNCKYEHAWGALTFNREFTQLLKPEFSHLGYGIVAALEAGLLVRADVAEGCFWDCGTPSEYISYLISKEI